MKYSIVAKTDSFTNKIKEEIIEKVKGTYSEEDPDVVFTVGGDGTVLDAVIKYVDILDKVKFITINTGNVGFYTEFLPIDLDMIIELLDKETALISYPLLQFKINDTVKYALNEIVVKVDHHLFEGKILVNEIELMDLRADGICISTPSGSTAYNKSLKGAVVDPTVEAVQLVVIAPFETVDKKVVSPLILSKENEILIKPKNKYFDISFDRVFISFKDIKEIRVKLSNKKVFFVKNKNLNFPKRIKEKFILKT